MYKVNKMGSSTLPCGTLNLWGAGSEWVLSMFGSPIMAHCGLLVRFECMHSRAVPDIPKQCFSWLNKIEWSTVSKAADRSSRTRNITSFLSMAW